MSTKRGKKDTKDKGLISMETQKVSQKEGDKETEVWDLKHVLTRNHEQVVCRTPGCNVHAVAVWVSNLEPNDEWPSCEECQLQDFGGWPENTGPSTQDETPLEDVDGTNATSTNATHDSTGDGNKDIEPTETNDTNISVSNERSNTLDEKCLGNENPSEDSIENIVQTTTEEEEVWDIKKILSINEITQECPIKCATESCRLPAALIYASNLAPNDKWYTCLDCQERDFGGWPEINDLPVQNLTSEHSQTLASHCSSKSKVDMPRFTASPNRGVTGNVSHAITPLPNCGNIQGIVEERNAGITPSPAPQSSKPSKKILELHRKWQEEAKAAGGDRIVVSKPEAKKLIFGFLCDAFTPMNITQIYTGLKKIVPNAVLNVCLEDMSLKNAIHDFADSDNEDKQSVSEKTKKKESDDPYGGSLCFKAGKSLGTSLYYVDYTKLKNNGDGLNPEERNELASKIAQSEGELEALKLASKRTADDTAKLISEPTNQEAMEQLEAGEKHLNSMKAKVEDGRKLKVNEKHKQNTKRRIDAMAAIWRKRRRICMDFLISMEENTEGTISVKKCLAGDGQIAIDSDEAIIKSAIAAAKQKRTTQGRIICKKNPKKTFDKNHENNKLPPSDGFVAVSLDSSGRVQRIFLDRDSS